MNEQQDGVCPSVRPHGGAGEGADDSIDMPRLGELGRGNFLAFV